MRTSSRARLNAPLDGMLDLLHFAYFEAMGLWIVPYALAGLFFTFIAGIKERGWLRLPCMAFILALFFSLSLVIDRIAVPLPTLFAVGLWAADIAQRAINPPACRSSTEGCVPPDESGVWIVVSLLIQWPLFYVLLATLNLSWRAIGRMASKEGKRPTCP
jgi:hypothetical protein